MLIYAAVSAAVGASVAMVLKPDKAALPHGFHDGLQMAAQHGFPPAMLFSLLLWIAFSLYWEAAAKSASDAKTSESSLSRGFHLTLISVSQILVLLPVPGLRARWLPWPTFGAVAGLAIQIAFFSLAIWARQKLGRHWSGAVTTKVDHELIRTGPYRILRHPIYSALLGVYAGTALVSGEIRGLIGVALVCLAYWRKIRMEEHYLGGLFGAEYAAYQQESWAIIPGLL